MSSKPAVKITDRLRPSIPHYARAILREMFSDYAEVIILSRMEGGLGGGAVFLVQPISHTGAVLPAVVKVDRVGRTEREWLAYRDCIKDRMPSVAEIRQEPTFPRGSAYGGLWYPFVGANVFKIISLHDYCQVADTDAICTLLESYLFKSLDVLWTSAREYHPALHMQTEYDSFLPINLVIDLTESSNGRWLHPDTINSHDWAVGEAVQVSGFEVVNINYEKQRLSLDIPTDQNASFRIHVAPVTHINDYMLGDMVGQPFMGVIQKTQKVFLREQVAQTMGDHFDFIAKTFRLGDGTALPNPLAHLDSILSRHVATNVSFIHGDLHLNNIIVETEKNSAVLIDFAHARRGHVLRDLLHLESAVITQLLPVFFKREGYIPEDIYKFYLHLHALFMSSAPLEPLEGLEQPLRILESIRTAARPHMTNQTSWQEYYCGLIIYLIGSLKFGSLDQHEHAPYPKQLAFIGASAIIKLLNNPDSARQYIEEALPSKSNDTKQKITPAQLREILNRYFDLSELRGLMFDIGVDHENLRGSTQAELVVALIAYLERRNQLDSLIHLVQESRPKIDIDSI